jgi:hypothetical protein
MGFKVILVRGPGSSQGGLQRIDTLKYECVYLHAFETGSALPTGLSGWIGYYSARRPHSGLAGRTPDELYVITNGETKLVAWDETEPSLTWPQLSEQGGLPQVERVLGRRRAELFGCLLVIHFDKLSEAANYEIGIKIC